MYHRSVAVNMTVAGDYESHCLVNNMLALGSGLRLTVEPSEASTIWSAKQLETTFVVNATNGWVHLFKLAVRDKFGNLRSTCGTATSCDDRLQVSAKHNTEVKLEGSPLESRSKVEPTSPGYYTVQVWPLVSGVYNLNATLSRSRRAPHGTQICSQARLWWPWRTHSCLLSAMPLVSPFLPSWRCLFSLSLFV